MTDENITHQNDDAEYEIITTDASIDFMQDTMDAFLSIASVDAVYAEPVKKGDTLIISAAEVVAGAGFGIGSGSGGTEAEGGNGMGGGGGGRSFARPVAVIIASPEGVRVEPVIDVTKIALGFLTTAAVMIGLVMKMLRPEKTLKDLQENRWD